MNMILSKIGHFFANEKALFSDAFGYLDKYTIFYSKRYEEALDNYFLYRKSWVSLYKMNLFFTFLFLVPVTIVMFITFLKGYLDGAIDSFASLKGLFIPWLYYAILRYNPIYTHFIRFRQRYFTIKDSYIMAFHNEKVRQGYNPDEMK